MQKDSKLLVLLTRRRLQAFCGSRQAAGCLGRWRCWLQQFFWYALHNTAQHQQLHSTDLTDQLSKVSELCFTQKKSFIAPLKLRPDGAIQICLLLLRNTSQHGNKTTTLVNVNAMKHNINKKTKAKVCWHCITSGLKSDMWPILITPEATRCNNHLCTPHTTQNNNHSYKVDVR